MKPTVTRLPQDGDAINYVVEMDGNKERFCISGVAQKVMP